MEELRKGKTKFIFSLIHEVVKASLKHFPEFEEYKSVWYKGIQTLLIFS